MQIKARGRTLNLSIPRVMGILNVTPDSFSDGGKYYDLDIAIDHAAAMLDAGATIIDVGGQSTRPGAEIVSEEEEVARVVPVILSLVNRFDTFISVDTSKALVMKESIAAGVHLINDVRSLNEPGTIDIVASSQLPICLVHMQGNPSNMQQAPYYKNILNEIENYFLQQIKRCEEAGITKNRLLIDPGFGFGKTLRHNYQLLSKLKNFHRFGLPLLVGMSRKSMIGQLLNLNTDKLVSGNIACAVAAALQGAHIIRVHEVRQTVEAMHIVEAILKARSTYFQ